MKDQVHNTKTNTLEILPCFHSTFTYIPVHIVEWRTYVDKLCVFTEAGGSTITKDSSQACSQHRNTGQADRSGRTDQIWLGEGKVLKPNNPEYIEVAVTGTTSSTSWQISFFLNTLPLADDLEHCYFRK